MLRTFHILSIAAVSVLTVLAATFTASAADTTHANLGPVGPNEPIIARIGTTGLIAYYEPDNGKCAVSAIMFDATPNGGGEASTRVRVALHPGELFHLDGVKDEHVVLTCGPNAKLLIVLNRGEVLTKSASTALY
jgi:hypothetical protein